MSEQETDYTRHLEDLYIQTENLLNTTIHSALLSRDESSPLKLLQALEKCHKTSELESDKQTMTDETKIFVEKLEKLMLLWEEVEKYCASAKIKENLMKLREKGITLLTCVNGEGSLNAGGKFEWVNSVLIKSLINGHWLLVDNVNLCSPAVLDRLNGLLEPNGVLTISERGIDPNGRMVEIKPHKHFRLFFTMNPKNGEISRAMRNRGIELYVLRDRSIEKSSMFDLQSLIYLNGIQNEIIINTLIEIHEFISDLIIGEKPNTTHILQSAFLISQQINRGIDTKGAMTTIVIDIYYRTRADYEFNTNDAENSIKTKIDQILKDESNPMNQFNPNCTLKINDINSNSSLSKIKQQISTFNRYLKSNNCVDMITYYLLNHFYSVTSIEDLKLRYVFLKKYLAECVEVNVLTKLNDNFYKTLQTISGIESKSLPLDGRWISNSKAHNNIFLLLYFLTIKSVTEIEGTTKKKFTVLNYIEKIRKNIYSDKINDIVVREIIPLLMEFDECLSKRFISINNFPISDEQCIETVSCLQWRKHMFVLLQKDIKDVKEDKLNDILLQLHVHYKWFVKYCIQKIIGALKIVENESLSRIINKINSQLPTHFSELHRIGKHYQKILLLPPPIINAQQLEMVLSYDKINDIFDFYKATDEMEKIIGTLLTDKDIYTKLCGLKYKLKCDITEINKTGSEKEELEELKSLRNIAKEFVSIKYQNKTVKSDIQFIAMVDYFALLSIYKGRVNNEYEVLDMITVPYNLNGILRRYLETKDQRLLHEINGFVTYYLLNSLCIIPNRICCDGDQNKLGTKLSHHTPILTYLLTEFLINETGSIEVKFGEYRNSYSLYSKFNVIVWNYFHDISTGLYDFFNLESNYIVNSYKAFLEDFAKSLRVTCTSTNDSKDVVNRCIDAIHRAHGKQGNKTNNEEEKLIQLLQKCDESINKMKASTDCVEKLNSIADSYIYLNYLKALLNSKLSSIDPYLKREVKRTYLREEIQNFKDVTYSYEAQNQVYTIDEFFLCPTLKQKVDDLEEKYKELKEYLALRPKTLQYKNIVQDVQHAFSTILSTKNIIEYLEKMDHSIKVLYTEPLTSSSTDIKEQGILPANISSNIESFCQVLGKYTSTYPDIIEHLHSNLLELLYGIRLKENLVKKVFIQYDYRRRGLDLDKVLTSLVSFPCFGVQQSDCIKLTNLYLKDTLQNYCYNPSKLFKYLKCALLEIYNFAIISSKYLLIKDSQLVNHFEHILKRLVNIWNKQQETIEKEQSESQSLYKFKSANKTEEEEIQEEFDELFPSYHSQDFEEFQQQKLDDVRKEQQTKLKEDLINLEDIRYVYELQKKFIEIYMQTTWINPNIPKEECDHITPLIEKYKLFKLLLKDCVNSLDYSLDRNLLSSLTVLINVAKNFGNTTLDGRKSSGIYNFYCDSNIEEIKNCYHILRELERETNKYLEEWPEHPTLQNINTIITRIYNFKISSPITRFLTGFEILLTKCHEWEENAHSGVSLRTCISNVTEQIICWRKMELNMWKNSLNITYERMNLPIAKWWCYLYNVIDQFENNLLSESDLIDSIQKFITQSNLAEFKNRLELLKLYHCQCVHLKKTKTLQNLLWNIYNYYLQFLPNVSAKIKDLRNPIEQKLKDYVKIVRWKDISYWAVKDTLVKTHKIIHKHMREFEKILRQSVQPHLILSGEKHNIQVGIWDETKNDSAVIDYNIYISNVSNVTDTNQRYSKEGLMRKSNKYFTKSKSLCQKIISSQPYPKLIENLQEFLTEIIKTSFHLQHLEIDKSLPQSKQKSQAKSILQQKRRALADLFKALSRVGLSYKKGILESNLEEDVKQFHMDPIDLELMLKIGDKTHCNVEHILKSWSGSESYYLKSLIRLDILQNVLVNPSKDLGLHEVERCKGFPINLMNNIFEQKENLIGSTNDLEQLMVYTIYFKRFCETKSVVKTEYLICLTETLKKAIVIVEQYKIILNTCPDKNDLETNLKDIPLLKNVEYGLCYKNEEMWNNIITLLNNVLDKIEITFIVKLAKQVNLNFMDLDIQYMPIDNLVDLDASIKEIEEMLRKVLNILGDIPLSESFKWITNTICDCRKKLIMPTENDDCTSRLEEFEKQTEKLIGNILLSIQSSFKLSEALQSKTSGEEEKEEDILQENHLNLLTRDGIHTFLTSLNIKEILKIIIKMKNHLQKVCTYNCKFFKEIINNSLPLLDQYLLLYQFFFTQQVASYKITSKINSVLLNIFTDLITKGFCIPPEFSDELSTEGSSQQSSGMGLGDGDGEKDVSDKIESEDQLEEAKPDGHENNEKEEDKDCKEEEGGIEMSEDFDSKLQDVERKDGDEEDNRNSDNEDSNAEEQMGETEVGADQLDEEIWGSDNEVEEPKDGNSKEDEKGSGGENLNEEEIGAKENDSEEKQSESKEQPRDIPLDKELNEEFDDEQIDPYHQNQHEMQEPEPLDLPEDLHLEDGDDKEEENQEENPFDIDEMKDKFPETIPEEPERKSDDKKDDQDQNGDDDDEEKEDLENTEQSEKQEDKKNEEEKDIEQGDSQEVAENITSEQLDQTNSKSEETQQPMDVYSNENQSSDKLASNETKGQNTEDITNITEQENADDSGGQGQCQSDQNEGGHRDTSVSQQMSNTDEQTDIKNPKRMGESDSDRSLGDTTLPVRKKLKTIHADNNRNEDQDDNADEQNRGSDMYQHIKEGKKYKDQVLDAATQEQVEQQKIVHDDKEDNNTNNEPQSSDDVPLDMNDDTEEVNVSEKPIEKSQNVDKEEKSSDRKVQHPDGEILQDMENVVVEGDITQTMQVPRGNESFFSQNTPETLNKLKHLPQEDLISLRQQIEQQLSTWIQPPTNEAAQTTWEEISSVTSSLAHHLAEQLRLVLEPTQASRLKGDFKTGKRINMRKIIPYIASQFRKDKIWLRRTKPAKREYQIVLAIDDSSSMADNHSKELAFESVALISRALTLLESGELSILSFGESTQVLHRLSDPFTEKNGASILQKFQFAEKKTYVGQMLKFATEMLNSSIARSNAVNAKLLVVVSDGRGIFSEGETFVHEAIRNARLSNIFTIFIIIDNPENNSSILDIRRAVFRGDNSIDVQSYMDTFPFPFYIVLRDINSLPNVLSDALRQWFEMVSNASN